jgi:hypothetical protein
MFIRKIIKAIYSEICLNLNKIKQDLLYIKSIVKPNHIRFFFWLCVGFFGAIVCTYFVNSYAISIIPFIISLIIMIWSCTWLWWEEN